ncbi:MAG: nitroreductase family protein [Oscillospiraceae bacterium]|nr:nitroreductase family protein [Oscillospiraceae bacterium]MBR3848867.1 nitroreductase family protein [Oscillospiraceae bacterium]
MEFEKLITERYSVRQFKPEHLSAEDVSKILEAAHKAPTGCNYQPQRILVLNTESSLEQLKKCTKCHFNAPTAMLVCYNEEESWKRVYDGALSAPVDAAIVATHMMLAAHDLGAGCCWVMHFDPSMMKKEFNIPDHIKPLALLVMGYPADTSEPLDLHHSFRPQEELVRYDRF